MLFSTSYSINVCSQSEPTIPSVVGCQIQLDKQPADAVEMNSAVVKATVKSIHVEKEVFICETERGPRP
jgi:hypothetical protein